MWIIVCEGGYVLLSFYPYIPSKIHFELKPIFLLQHGIDTLGDEGFFDLLSRFQGNRMDDQRCFIQDDHNRFPSTSLPTTPTVASKKCELAPIPTSRLMLTAVALTGVANVTRWSSASIEQSLSNNWWKKIKWSKRNDLILVATPLPKLKLMLIWSSWLAALTPLFAQLWNSLSHPTWVYWFSS